VGRERELRELELVWQAAAAGAGAATIIRGEAGIGKTRLVTELGSRAAAAGALIATSAALDLGGSAPLSLWAELTRELLPSLPAPGPESAWPDDLAVLVSELPSHFGRSGTPAAAIAPDLVRTRLFEAVVALVAWATRRAPLLLVLEDIHGADRPSLELAGYAARRLGGQRVMMVFTRRELPPSSAADQLEHALRARGVLACELELGPLPAGRGAALARSVARLTERDVGVVVDRAEGNPLLVVETARALAGGRQDVAPGLRGLVRGTFSALSGEARRLVELAAVAGRPMRSEEMAEPAVGEQAAAASEALESGLLQGADGALGFRHGLLREAVYEDIAEPRRRDLHRAWAQALLARRGSGAVGGSAEIALHLRLAGDDLQAVPHLARAAADARGVAALEQAAAYLREALAIDPDEADLWLELGEIEAWRAERERAEEAFARANALLLDADALRRARAWLRRARAYHGPICVPRAVLESARTAIELLAETSEPSDEERGEALAAWAWAEAVAGSVDEAERLLVELRAVPSTNEQLRTYDSGHARALALMRRGRFTDCYAPSIAAGDAVGRAGRPDLTYGCWANAASAATAAGELDRALEFLDRADAAVAGHGLQGIEIHLLAARSFVLRRLGRLEEARAAAETERGLADRLAQPGLSAMASHDAGLGALAAGDYDQAITHLTESLVEGAPISRPATRLALAEALARGGAPDQAAEQIRETVLEPLRPSDFPDALVPRLARVQGLIALARDDRAEAARRLEEAVSGWERLLERSIRADSITGVLADLGRPVVGLLDPEGELAQARADLSLIAERGLDAVLP
jgi:tetratricopeptide (TPR) repeat protein